VIALAIKLTDPGPVFFRQTRVGKDSQPFMVWKFRTMVVNAEARKTELLASNDGNGALFKMRRDPRVTRASSWLRRWSLDELPQLFNVVLGNMSMVGPRPALAVEVAEYRYHMRRRLVVKPGITGLWQVSGRSDLSSDEAERLDLRYVENWSLALDARVPGGRSHTSSAPAPTTCEGRTFFAEKRSQPDASRRRPRPRSCLAGRCCAPCDEW
jgi:lipopolysaccharide/colanic/teichoic acid biosynthesis glycosyltransferase